MAGARRAIAAALLLLTGACGDDGRMADGAGAGRDAGDAGDAATAQLPADVDEVLELSCRPCHANPVMRFAPMPIVDWDDTRRPGPYTPESPVYELIGVRVASEGFPMPPKESPELLAMTEDQRQILINWSGAGGPAAQ